MHIVKAVADIGEQMGMDLKLNPDGICTLNLGETDSLFLERRGDVLAISLARRVDKDLISCLERGLELCHLKNEPRHGLRISLFRDNALVATSKLERYHMDAGMTEQILPYLFEVMNKIQEVKP
ncbi:MAG: hypothetical protein RBR67_07165 [Desulfobacterium sp.]|jgi:type III secretion system chaperone SycN|nr:hypothetical protein [Desulfobacterium sp.]